jgi:hypothetical protein
LIHPNSPDFASGAHLGSQPHPALAIILHLVERLKSAGHLVDDIVGNFKNLLMTFEKTSFWRKPAQKNWVILRFFFLPKNE